LNMTTHSKEWFSIVTNDSNKWLEIETTDYIATIDLHCNHRLLLQPMTYISSDLLSIQWHSLEPVPFHSNHWLSIANSDQYCKQWLSIATIYFHSNHRLSVPASAFHSNQRLS
jgi:hypothetical protein